MLQAIRSFFAERGVLEVETPLLAAYGVTEPHLSAFDTLYRAPGSHSPARRMFLQTSPEFAMKRLLASGVGSIYQVCKAFRNEEQGRRHNPEFTLLEWYRVGFGLEDLIGEVELLLRALLAQSRPALRSARIDYRTVFGRHVGADPITADIASLDECARRSGYPEAGGMCGQDRALWLDFLFSQRVQPRLVDAGLVFVTDFPRCLPSLARAHRDDPAVVERVEVFLDGIELGNGFHELADAAEQARRFAQDLATRRALGLTEQRQDPRLLGALEAGLPDCSGIAIGLDRLLMAVTGAERIDEVLAFAFERA